MSLKESEDELAAVAQRVVDRLTHEAPPDRAKKLLTDALLLRLTVPFSRVPFFSFSGLGDNSYPGPPTLTPPPKPGSKAGRLRGAMVVSCRLNAVTSGLPPRPGAVSTSSCVLR